VGRAAARGERQRITIKSADLRSLFEGLGYGGVRTVLASGNVVFEADGDPGALKTSIEQALGDRFGYDAWIVLVPHDALAAVLDASPFETTESHHAYVVFGSDPMALDDLLDGFEADDRAAPGQRELVQRGEGVVYWSCPKGSSTDTPFAKRSGAARFKRTTTTRNENTLRKLL
jgi:uncharacterized protein (DUF1697 family)